MSPPSPNLQWPEILVFELGGRRFGLPASEVLELLRAVAIVPLPRSSALVEGVINLRGRVVTVLDLRARLGLPPKDLEPSDHLVVASARGRLAAFRVDRALELRTPGAAATEDAARLGLDHLDSGLIGVAGLPDGLVPVLDLRDLLNLVPEPSPAVAEAPR